MFSVVIPNYNGREFLEKCLNSIFKNYRQIEDRNIERKNKNSSKSPNVYISKPLSLEIIVVDNNSTDGSKEYLKKLASRNLEISSSDICRSREINFSPEASGRISQFLNLKVIFNKKNLGFAAAVNQGILAAKNDYVVVMNNDLRLEKNWFQVMAATIKKYPAQKNKIAAYFGTVLNWDGSKIESRGLKFWLKGKAKNIDNGKPFLRAKIKNKKPKFLFGASASVVVYYKPALKEVGFFDEDFFAYEEDVDLALRLWGAGWKTLYVPQAIAYHLGGGTSQKMGNFRQRMDAKNWWFIVIKNYPLSVLIRHGPEIFLERLRNLSGLLKATPVWRWIPDVIRTYGEVLVKLSRMIGKRKPIEKLGIRS